MKNWIEDERAIYLVVALFVLLGALYAVTTPLFEAGDELWHYPFVQWVARGNGLPVQDPAQKQLWEQEGGQPPLYYALAAATTFWIDTRDVQERLWRNPYAKIGVPLAFGNKNLIVHTTAENFPWQGTALAVHLIRLLSVCFSAGTVYLTFRIAQELLSPSRTFNDSLLALFAACIVAFNPMFLFISASVNNDSLAALLAASALFLIAQLAARGATNARLFATGVICGLAVLTKVSNLAVVIVALAVVAWLAWRARDGKLLLRGGGFVLVSVGVIAGWWFARNFVLYGDPLAFNVWLQIAGGRPPQTLLGLLDEFQGLRISFWGNFGGVNLIAPDWAYAVLDIFTLLAFIGLVIGVLAKKGNHEGLPLPHLVWIPALQVVVVFVALVRWTLLTYASQGRLLFPAIAAIGILLAFGLYALAFYVLRLFDNFPLHAPRSIAMVLPALFVLFLLLFAIAAPFLLIAPAYAQPPRVDKAAVPNPVHIRFDTGGGNGPELVGFETTRFLTPGRELPLTLYWRTDAPLADDLAMYAHVYDTRGNLLGQWDALPGNGLLPTRLWNPGEIYRDEYRVPVNAPQTYPPIGRIEVGMARVGTTRPLLARNPQGQAITPSLATIKFAQPVGLPADARATFGDQFNLVNLDLSAQRGEQEIPFEPNAAGTVELKPGDVLKVAVTLQALDTPDADYTLFSHLVDTNGKIVAQRDAQPLDNTYATTLWDSYEQVSDTLAMQLPRELPAGEYALEFGIYRASDLQRLPVTGADWGWWRVMGDHLLGAPVRVTAP